MSPATMKLLVALNALDQDGSEEPEVVCEGTECYVGTNKVHRRTVYNLLGMLALKDTSDVKGMQRYELNDVGRALLARPELELEIYTALRAGDPFHVTADHRVALSPAPGAREG